MNSKGFKNFASKSGINTSIPRMLPLILGGVSLYALYQCIYYGIHCAYNS